MAPKAPPKKPAPRRVGSFSLRVVRGPDDAGRWYWRITTWKDKKEATVWTGWATTADAEKEAAHHVIDPQRTPSSVAPTEIHTIRDLCEIYLGERQEDVAKRTWINIRDRFRAVVADLGDVAVARLNVRDLEKYVRSRRPVIAPGTLALEVRYLATAWRWAIQRDLIPDRKFPSLPLKSDPVSERHTPETADILKVLDFLRTRADWRYPAVLLMAETGARLGEIAALRRCDVDRERLVIRVNGKTGGREIPITPQVYADLRLWLVGDAEGGLFGVSPLTVRGLTCPNPGKTGVTNLAGICAAAGVKRFTPHGLRRACVVRCFQAGMDPKLEASLAGHSIEVALKCYRAVSAQERSEAIGRISLHSHNQTRTN